MTWDEAADRAHSPKSPPDVRRVEGSRLDSDSWEQVAAPSGLVSSPGALAGNRNQPGLGRPVARPPATPTRADLSTNGGHETSELLGRPQGPQPRLGLPIPPRSRLGEFPDFPARLGQFLIDASVLAFPSLTVLGVSAAASMGADGSKYGLLPWVVISALWGTYFTLLPGLRGTLGMRIVGLACVDGYSLHGAMQRMTNRQAVVRGLAFWVPPLLLTFGSATLDIGAAAFVVVDALSPLGDPHGRSLHDRLAGVAMVRTQ